MLAVAASLPGYISTWMLGGASKAKVLPAFSCMACASSDCAAADSPTVKRSDTGIKAVKHWFQELISKLSKNWSQMSGD